MDTAAKRHIAYQIFFPTCSSFSLTTLSSIYIHSNNGGYQFAKSDQTKKYTSLTT